MPCCSAQSVLVIAPQYLSNGSLLTTNCLEPNLWMGCAYFAILAIKRSNPRYWLWFGVVAGLGLEEKYTIAVFGLGIVVGLLLTEHRRVFLNKWIWIGRDRLFPDNSSQLSVEHSLRLAIRAVDARHPGRRSGRSVGPSGFLRATDTACYIPSLPPFGLQDCWPHVLGSTAALSHAGLVLPGVLCSVFRVAREGLLPGADLSHAAWPPAR